MHLAACELTDGMVDALMGVAALLQSTIRAPLVTVDRRSWGDTLSNLRQ